MDRKPLLWWVGEQLMIVQKLVIIKQLKHNFSLMTQNESFEFIPRVTSKVIKLGILDKKVADKYA